MAVWLAVGLWLCLGCRCAVVPSGPVCRCTKARECRDGLRGPRTNPCILDTDYLRKAFWWTRARRSPSSSGRRRRCDVRRFTRLANYFRRFVEGYAKVAEVNPRDPLCGGYQRPRVLVRSSLSPAPQNSGATPAPPPPVPPNDVSTGATPAPPPPVPPNDLFLSPTFVQALATELDLDPIFGPIRRGAAAALSRLVDRHGASVTDPAPNPANRRAGRFRCVVASCIAEDRSRRRRAGCAGAPRLP